MGSKAEEPGGGEGSIDIHQAVAHNREDQIKQYVDAGGDLDRRDGNNLAPLHIAAAGGFCNVVEFLLMHKAGVDVTSKIGHSPLHLACRFGHLPVVLLLLAEGAELNARDADGNSPLHKAASNGKAQLCREMVKRGADIDGRNKTEYTPLHWACFKGHKAAAEQLLKCGANIDATSSRRATSLFMSTYYGHVDVTFLLLAWGADVTVANEDNVKAGETFLPEVPETQQGQIKVLLKERQPLLMKGYEAARRNMALMYMRSERSDLNLRMSQGEVETLWGKLAKREKELNMSKMGARDLSHAVKAMKSALEQGRNDAKAMREKLAALETELNEAKDEAQEQRERAARAERSYATLLEEGRGRASSYEGDGEEERSSTLQRELQAEEEGGGVEKSSVKVGGLTQSYSKDGAPEWKWLGNCPKDGKRSPDSSTSSPPPLLPRVSSAATNSLDPTWHFDPSPILSSGIISVQAVGSTVSSPVLTSEFPEPGRIAALASRIETRHASPDEKNGGSTLTSPVQATVPGNVPGKADVGPLATALPLPPLAATTAAGPALRSRSNSGRWVMKHCSSSTSLTPEPMDEGRADGGTGGGSGSCSAAGSSSGGSRNGSVLRRSSSSAATAPQQEDGGVAPAVPRNVPRAAGSAAVGSSAGKDDDALAVPTSWEQGGKIRPALLGKSSGGSSISSSSSFGSDDSGFCSALGSRSPDEESVPPKGGRADVGGGDGPLMLSKDQQVRSPVDGGEEGGVDSSSCSEATLPASPDKGGGCG
ncbi:unnamed protein product [Ectocarpus sp. 6 AP-2014]